MDDRPFIVAMPRVTIWLLAALCMTFGACASSDGTPSVPVLLGTTILAAAGVEPDRPDFYADAAVVSATQRFIDIAAGAEHSCGIDVDGATWCWGSNQHRQLGDAQPAGRCASAGLSCSSAPVRVEAAPRFTVLEASLWSTCGLDAAGAAWCWGFGTGPAPAGGMPASSGVPQRVVGDSPFVALAASPAGNDVCALTQAGAPWCWRVGTARGLSEPVRLAAGVRLIAIDVGAQHGCGIDANHAMLCWGSNQFGQLGVGASALEGGPRESTAPVVVAGAHEFMQVAAGPGHSCGLRSDGQAYCWGQNFATAGAARPQRPDRRTLPHGGIPVPVETPGAPWITLSAGTTQTCALAADGAVHCLTTIPTRYAVDGTAARIPGAQVLRDVAIGGQHGCGIDAGGIAYCWGLSQFGQAGRPPDP